MRLTGDDVLIFRFLRFSIEEDGIFAVSSWGKGDFRVSCVSLPVFFAEEN